HICRLNSDIVENCRITKINMDCKEEISDSDSGVILNSGECFYFELTGKLPSDYPLLPDEKPPQVRRRIGAAFKLDEGFISQDGEDSELHALEADLALQRQIYEAVRKLSLEEHISKPVRKSRLQQCKREEKKLKELQDAILKHRINHGCVSPQTCYSSRQRDLCMSDDSSLSDAVALDDDILYTTITEQIRLPRSKPELTKASSDLGRGRTKLPRRRVTDFALAYSVQRLYQCSSEDSSSELSISSYSSSSSRETTNEAPKPCPPPYGYHRTAPNKGLGQLNTHSTLKNNNNNPPHLVPRPNQVKISNGTPLQVNIGRLQLGPNSQSDPVHTNKPQQVQVTSPKRMLKPPPPYTKVVRTMSLREYPNHPSRVLPREVISGELKIWHQKNNIAISKPCSLERQGSIRIKCPEPPPYHHIPSHKQVSQKVILQRASDGTPLQWYEEEDSEIVSQV
ncbi:hypothetical protein cypCar_00022882, partial [Cyprinus carpio]